MPTSVLTLTANTLVDCLATSPVRPGRVHRVERFELAAGGKGLNVARVLVAFGHRVIAAGFAGGWSGALLRERIAADGAEPLLVETAARTRIGFDIASEEGGTAFLESGFAVRPEEVRGLARAVCERLGEVELVLISGSVPDRSCEDLYARVLESCAAAGVPCWIDSYGPALGRALSGAHPPALAKANAEELGDGKGFDTCAEVHVTDGPRAVHVRSPAGRFIVRPPALKERSAIGSGDCYFAALAHGRLRGMSQAETLRWAAAAGAANAALGATARIGPGEIEPWLAGVEVARYLETGPSPPLLAKNPRS